MVDVNPIRTVGGQSFTRSQRVVLATVLGGHQPLGPPTGASPSVASLARRGFLARTRGRWELTVSGRAVAVALALRGALP